MSDRLIQLGHKRLVPREALSAFALIESRAHAMVESVLSSVRMHPRQVKPDLLLQAELDAGEAAVIATARQLGLSAVILDERKACRIAPKSMG